MAWRLARSLVSLRNEVNEQYPTRSKISDGSVGDLSHSARKSDHNPDGQGIVRAIDVTEWDPGTPRVDGDDVAEALAEFLRAGRDRRVKYVIWRGRMFSSYGTTSRRPWTWGPYSGPNGHFHHVHVSVVPGSVGDLAGDWGFKRPGIGKPDPNLGRPWKPFGAPTSDAWMYAAGARNDEVAELQWLLNILGYGPLRVDGKMPRDGATSRALVAFKDAATWKTASGARDRSSHVSLTLIRALRDLAAAL